MTYGMLYMYNVLPVYQYIIIKVDFFNLTVIFMIFTYFGISENLGVMLN